MTETSEDAALVRREKAFALRKYEQAVEHCATALELLCVLYPSPLPTHWVLSTKTCQITNTCRRRAEDGGCVLRIQKGVTGEHHCAEFGSGKGKQQKQEDGA